MAHITLPEGVPGIRGLLMQHPEIEKPLGEFTETLMRGPSSLTLAERELIATYVSAQNDCHFCMNAHRAAARHLLMAEGESPELVDQTRADFQAAPLSAKMKALLVIAGKVQQGGRRVTDEDVAQARAQGADDKALHDTVLIAAAFCMFNRYVDGLATSAPEDPAAYDQGGARLAQHGYLNSIKPKP